MRYFDIRDGKRWVVDPVEGAIACSKRIETFKNTPCQKKLARDSVIRKVRGDFKEKGIEFRRCQATETDCWLGRAFQLPDGEVVVNSQRVTVKFRKSKNLANIKNLFKELDLEIQFKWKICDKTFDVSLPAKMDPFKLVSKLSHRKDVVYAVPEFVGLGTQRFVPDDKKYGDQWQYKTDKLEAEPAWEISRGKDMKLAVIDWGFKVSDEIASAVTLAGTFRIDNTFSSDIADLPKADHGTWCVNLAAGRANNDFAGCGMANQASLILVSTNERGLGSPQDFARAIEFATDPSVKGAGFKKSDGADVISCSITPPQSNVMHPVIEDALKFAATKGRRNNGTPVFFAVANKNVPISKDPIASSKYVIAIGRSTKHDKRYNSAYGADFDFLAPGRNVKVGRSKTRLKTVSGTSYATPLAAGTACLILSQKKSMSRMDLIRRLRKTCDKIGNLKYKDGFNKKYGYGRINAHRALTET